MKELLAKRQEAEDNFNMLKASVDAVKAELQKYGVETLADAEAELMRLQGEYRLINKLISEKESKVKPAKAKDPATTIDATEVEETK